MSSPDQIVSSPGMLTSLTIAVASLASGVSLGWFLYNLLSLKSTSLEHLQGAQFGMARRHLLSEKSRVFRWFEPLVVSAARSQRLMKLGRLDRVAEDLATGCMQAPWTPELYIATTAVRALAIGSGVALLLRATTPLPAALMFGGLVVAMTFYWTLQRAHVSANLRRRQFLHRLPYAVDLISMLMESGATFREAAATVVKENRGHPLGEEFGIMLRELDRGQPLFEALLGLRSRIGQAELSELVFTVQKSQELGTPLGKVFLRLAGQMRIERSQAAEKAAGKANANITFPGLLVMFACVILIVAPFILKALANASHVF